MLNSMKSSISLPSIEELFDMDIDSLIELKEHLEKENTADAQNNIENEDIEMNIKTFLEFVDAEIKERHLMNDVVNFFLSSNCNDEENIDIKIKAFEEIEQKSKEEKEKQISIMSIKPITQELPIQSNPIIVKNERIQDLLLRTKCDSVGFPVIIGASAMQKNLLTFSVPKRIRTVNEKEESKGVKIKALKSTRIENITNKTKVNIKMALDAPKIVLKKKRRKRKRKNDIEESETNYSNHYQMRKEYIVPNVKNFILKKSESKPQSAYDNKSNQSTTIFTKGHIIEKQVIDANCYPKNAKGYNNQLDIQSRNIEYSYLSNDSYQKRRRSRIEQCVVAVSVENYKSYDLNKLNSNLNLNKISEEKTHEENTNIQDNIINDTKETKSNLSNCKKQSELEGSCLNQDNSIIINEKTNNISEIGNESLSVLSLPLITNGNYKGNSIIIETTSNMNLSNNHNNTESLSPWNKLIDLNNAIICNSPIHSSKDSGDFVQIQSARSRVDSSSIKRISSPYLQQIATHYEQIKEENDQSNVSSNEEEENEEDTENITEDKIKPNKASISRITNQKTIINAKKIITQPLIPVQNKFIQMKNFPQRLNINSPINNKNSNKKANSMHTFNSNMFNTTTNFYSQSPNNNNSHLGTSILNKQSNSINNKPQSALPQVRQRVFSSKVSLSRVPGLINSIVVQDYSKIYKSFNELFNGYFLSNTYSEAKQFNIEASINSLYDSFKGLFRYEQNTELLKERDQMYSDIVRAEAGIIENRLKKVSDRLIDDDECITSNEKYYVYKKVLELEKKDYGTRQSCEDIPGLNKNKMFFRVVLSRPEIYDIVCYTLGTKEQWSELPHGLLLGNCWNLLWTYATPSIDQTKIFSFQKVNHLINNRIIHRKDYLKKHIYRIRNMNKKLNSLFDIMPKTYLLAKEYMEFVEEFHKNGKDNPLNLWIVKPVGKSRGKGIYLINDISDVPLADSFLVQQYLTNPLLVEGYKFDMRIYVLVTSVNPLELFLYKDGFARVSTEKFDLFTKNRKIHLTNAAIQNCLTKGSQNYEKVYGGSKISLDILKYKLSKQHIDFDYLWKQVQSIVLKTLIASQCDLPYSPSTFELFGFDIIIDENAKCWLLEVNSSPSLERSNALDDQIKLPLVDDILKIVEPMNYDREAVLKVFERVLKINNSVKGDVYLYSPAIQLNMDLTQIFRGKIPRAYGEMPNNIGQFERLAPTKESDYLIKITGGQKYFGKRDNDKNK